MNGIKALKIFGLWLLLGLAMLGYTFYSSPMAGAFLFGVLLSILLAFIGASLHIFFAWKNSEWSGAKSAATSFFLLFLMFIVIAGSGIFNFT